MVDFPETPTLLELGYDIIASSLITIESPGGLSDLVVETLQQAFKKTMEDADFIKISRQLDQPALYRGPAELATHITEINESVGALIHSRGLRKE